MQTESLNVGRDVSGEGVQQAFAKNAGRNGASINYPFPLSDSYLFNSWKN